MKLEIENIITAYEIGSRTLVGTTEVEYPRQMGNCFSLITDIGAFRVVNFIYENLIFLLKEKIIEFPISVIPLSERICVIVDSRIDKEWYQNKFCEVCTPIELLPIPQRIRHLLDIQKGIRKEKITDNGIIISIQGELSVKKLK